jgi:hypothetical protein
MIYAFIGLTHIFSEMIPDYSPSNTIAKVFIEATEMALESFRYIGGKGLVLLTRAASTRWCNKLVSELPSWCPDWTAKEPRRHDDRPAYFFPLSEPYYFLSDPQRSKWKILRVQAVFLTNVGDKDDQGIFRNSLRLHFGKSSCVAAGDELWALNGGVSIHVLRKREGHNGEYILVGLALPYPSKAKHIGGRMPVELDDYEIAMETARTKGVKWIEIF